MPKRIPTISHIASLVLDLRTGLGAAKLSHSVKKITLFTTSRRGGVTAKKFWRQHLPRIAYNNPHVEFEIKVKDEMNVRPRLYVSFDDANKKPLKIDCSHLKTPDGVCRRLLHEADGVPALLVGEDALADVVGSQNKPRWGYYSN
ncbi:6650_t:CDS:2 [Paraglomus brasilianum]|uniref:6650_t:CDS:1 n=1 Tax=Paraglomus brasilianum TaxID=144538 RepID=A0A9N9BB06_9GLOM|nr:6650_t:CDS:2 [Paraglomus brasilianum]